MSQNFLPPDDAGVKQKIRGFAKGVISDVKAAFGIHSPSAVMRDEVGKYLALGVAEGLAENDKFVVQKFTAMLEKLNYQRDFDIISEDEYYTRLENLRDRYFSKGTQNWVKYTEKIYEYQQKLLENEKKALEEEKKGISGLYDSIAAYAEERLNGVIAKQNSFAAKLKSTGSLFDINKATINGTTYKYYSLHDLDKDIEQIRNYSELLEKIKSRADELGIDKNISDSFLSELRGLDINSAIGLSNILMTAQDKKFAAYLNSWNIKQETAALVSAKQYEGEFEDSWKDAYQNMKQALEGAGYEIPEGFYVSGSLSAERFGDAFIKELDLQMERIRGLIDEFNASLKIDVNADAASGNIYNTTNTSYNITGSPVDTVERIQRYETLKRLSGIKQGG